MTTLYIPNAVVALFLTSACGTPSSALEQRPTNAQAKRQSPSSPQTSSSLQRCQTVEQDPVAFEHIEVEFNHLSMQVSYAGGCGAHTFQLCWNGVFLESDPVQVNVGLIHDAQGDSCEAVLTRSLDFDLSLLSSSYAEKYKTTRGTVLLRIAGTTRPFTF